MPASISENLLSQCVIEASVLSLAAALTTRTQIMTETLFVLHHHSLWFLLIFHCNSAWSYVCLWCITRAMIPFDLALWQRVIVPPHRSSLKACVNSWTIPFILFRPCSKSFFHGCCTDKSKLQQRSTSKHDEKIDCKKDSSCNDRQMWATENAKKQVVLRSKC